MCISPGTQRPVEVVCRTDQRHMRERLRHILPSLSASKGRKDDTDSQALSSATLLLGVKLCVIAVPQEVHEHGDTASHQQETDKGRESSRFGQVRLVVHTRTCQCLDTPQRAQREGALLASHAIVRLGGIVPENARVRRQSASLRCLEYGVECGGESWIRSRDEEDKRHNEDRGVERVFVFVGLGEVTLFLVPALLLDSFVQAIPCIAPFFPVRTWQLSLLRQPDTTVQCDPTVSAVATLPRFRLTTS